MHVKRPYLAIYSLIFSCVILFMTLDIHLPSLPQITAEFQTTPFKAQLIFIVSYCQIIFMPLLWGPLCDYIGRKKTIMIAMGIGLSGQLLCALATSIDTLIAFRFIQYLGSGAIGSVTMSVICDLLKEKERARALALFEASTPFALIIAPIIGGFTCEHFGWRGNFLLLFGLQCIAFSAVLFWVPETLKKLAPPSFSKTLKSFAFLLQNATFIKWAFILGFLEAAWVIFVANSSFFYIDKYGFSPHQFSYYQVIPVAVYFFGLSLYRKLVDRTSIESLIKFGIVGYSVFGVFILLGLLHIIPLSPMSTLLMLCFGNLAASLVSPGANTKAFETITEDMYGTSSSLINVIIGSVPGIFMFITILFWDEAFVSVFVNMLITVLVVVLLWMSLTCRVQRGAFKKA